MGEMRASKTVLPIVDASRSRISIDVKPVRRKRSMPIMTSNLPL